MLNVLIEAAVFDVFLVIRFTRGLSDGVPAFKRALYFVCMYFVPLTEDVSSCSSVWVGEPPSKLRVNNVMHKRRG